MKADAASFINSVDHCVEQLLEHHMGNRSLGDFLNISMGPFGGGLAPKVLLEVGQMSKKHDIASTPHFGRREN